MRGPRLFLFFPPKVGDDKKKVFMSADVAFADVTENIGEDPTKKKVFVVRDEAPHFLRGPHFLWGPRPKPP